MTRNNTANTRTIQIAFIESYGYKYTPRLNFEATCEVVGLVERASAYNGDMVFYDPDGDCEEIMLVGFDSPDFLNQCVNLLIDCIDENWGNNKEIIDAYIEAVNN